MRRVLYLDCSLGASGDMLVAAMLDAGADEGGLRRALEGLPVEGIDVRVSRTTVSSLDACDCDVVLDGVETHDHDMDYLYGNGEVHGHDRGHDHGHRHGHAHRNLADVCKVIDAAGLDGDVSELAKRVFGIVADAEAKAHGVARDEVHFHEVGALDSIADIVAAAWCLCDLAVDDVVVSPLGEGEGTVRCAHGVLPVPVPAVANIAAAHGLPLAPLHRAGEFVTPTGAAIVAAARTSEALPPTYRVLSTGIGAGKRAYEPRSFVRAMLVEDAGQEGGLVAAPGAAVGEGAALFSAGQGDESLGVPHLWKLETEVDDCTGEALGRVLELLYDAGAAEAHFLPTFMKKNRPGYQIEVLCGADKVADLERVLFEETTTIGVRRSPLWRTCLEREMVELATPLGTLVAKVVTLPGGERRAYPEHDSVERLAGEAGVSYQSAWRCAVAACEGYDAR